MTEQQLRQKVVSIMEGWLGCKESDGSHRKIIDTYNTHMPRARSYRVTYTDAWCATAVSAAFIKAGLTDIGPTECSCNEMIKLYQKKGRWQENDGYKPEPGDVIFYDWQDNGAGDNKGASDHVGIVVSVSGNTMKIIEGNYSDSVKYRTLEVDGRYIRGYGLPNYASKIIGGPVSGDSAQTPSDTTPAKKPATAPKVDPARSFERSYAKSYTVTASALNMRTGANTTKTIIKALPEGSKVTCYGYYTKIGATIWLLVKDADGVIGFCSKKYLK